VDLAVHRIPPGVFATIAEGQGGADAARRLVAAQHSKHTLLIRQVVESACAAAHKEATEARHAYDVLAAIQDRAPEAVSAVLDHPPVGSWARHTIRMLRDPETRVKAVPAQLAALAAAAAIHARTTCSIEVPVIDEGVMLPSLGKVLVPIHETGRRLSLEITDGEAEINGQDWSIRLSQPLSVDQPGWHALRSLSATAEERTLQILVEDLDSYRMPGSANIGARLSAAESDYWEVMLGGALDLLARHHSHVADELTIMVRAFTPLTPPSSGQVSATSRETFGSIALSFPPDACSLAATIAHEIQHAKLSALLDVVSLTLPDDGARYYAPWRDDPRPVSGLIQGAYAFLGVAAFWRRQRHLESGAAAVSAHAEFVRWRCAVELVVDTLTASGRLTDPGQAFVAGMRRTLGSWAEDQVPASAVTLAIRAAAEHRALWYRRHGEIQRFEASS
jgi:uncharacterized protein